MTDPTPCVRIAIDLDGVLTEHPRPLAAAASERFELQLPESAFVDSAGLNVPIAVREWVYSSAGPAANLAPSPGSQQFLAGVITLLGGENVHIVTARPRESAVMTRDWLSSNGYLPCDILFTDDKTSVARMHGCGYAVEDSERHARNYA
ncbi:MAG: phosphoglycerate dehydrogenase, partial [Chloroflexia bacterium]|nr:phosphoglycerate dehydrogenase [Chloroflexia bacterium]